MDRREFFATAVAGIAVSGSLERDAEAARLLAELESTVAASRNGRGLTLTTDVSGLLRSVDSDDTN